MNELNGPNLADGDDAQRGPMGRSTPLPFPNGIWDPETDIQS